MVPERDTFERYNCSIINEGLFKISKRTPQFERLSKDKYLTIDKNATTILDAWLREHNPLSISASWAEPCVGQGHIVYQMAEFGYKFNFAADIENYGMYGNYEVRDVFTLEKEDLEHCDLIITNPPWSRPVLHPMIEKFMSLGKETYLLFDTDWMFTKQATPYIDKWLTDVISVGRMNWIAGTKVKSLDNCSWYRFMPRKFSNITYWPNPLYSKPKESI